MAEGIKIRKIGNFRRLNYGNFHIAILRHRHFFLQGYRILIVNPHLLNMGNYPQHRLAGLFLQKINGRCQQGNIAPELIDDQPLH